MYVTVFIRNAANLTHLLTKETKFKKFDFDFNCPVKGVAAGPVKKALR
jgi:hypothetical protein